MKKKSKKKKSEKKLRVFKYYRENRVKLPVINNLATRLNGRKAGEMHP